MLTIKTTMNDAADAMTDATTEKAAAIIRRNVKLPDAAKTGAPCASSNYAAKIQKTAAALHVSYGNRKMGDIPSVSLPPVVTCNPDMCKHCAGKCYALRHIYKIYPAARASYDANHELYKTDADAYFMQLSAAMENYRYFRMHVSGDCPTADYFARLVKAVRKNAHCNVLMFTKQYSFVNDYLSAGHKLPRNLKLIMSGWGEIKPVNPYKLPETNVIFKGQTPPDDWKICPGNCSDCKARGVGCWTAKKGDVIAFHEH